MKQDDFEFWVKHQRELLLLYIIMKQQLYCDTKTTNSKE